MTLAELRRAALQECGILATGENAEPEDDALCAEKYATLHDVLLTESLVAWAVDEDLPAYADQPLTMMLAAVIAPAFGVSGQRLNDLRLAGMVGLPQPSLAERMLRRQLAKSYVSHTVKSEYF
jgi:hypothetical protein